MRIAVIAALALASTPAHAEFCGAVGLSAQVVSSADLVLPGDGGILVAALPGGFGHSQNDEADQPAWRFQTGGASSEPRRTSLAPGLVVYRARQDGTVVLLDHEKKARASVFVTRRPRPRLAAPVVRWSVRTPDRADVTLELADMPPDDAIAIVLLGKDGKARSWNFIDGDSTTQYPYKQRGCETAPPGTVASRAGDEVTFVFVDTYGRTSPPSKPITIADKKVDDRPSDGRPSK